MEDVKLLLKIKDSDNDNAPKWVHLCYVDEDIYTAYQLIQIQNDGEYRGINPTLSKWAKADFNVDLLMDSMEDIATLKGLVKDVYKEKYPEVYRDSLTDRQGWLRLWVNNHMKEEVANAQE